MATNLKSSPHLQTAHVLFVDVVGYSRLLVNEQREIVGELTEIVRGTPQFLKSDAAGDLIRIPVGDGMALVFFQTPEEPVHCAMEIARALQTRPHIRLRMGINSGPVDQVKDVNDQINVAGIGINLAQRVMTLADAGHILLSRRVAADLSQDAHWPQRLHDLGEVELKHGHTVGIVNLYTEDIGNSQVPQRVAAARQKKATKRGIALGLGTRLGVVSLALLLITLGIGLWKLQWIKSLESGNHRQSTPDKSIAVLPFENLSANPENTFFADGVQDEILTNLAKIADLKVISRTSSMEYRTGSKRNLREIAAALGVSHVVEGSVERAGDRIRIRAQLIDARTDMHLWAEQYDRDVADVFAIQSEIAKAVADQLQAKISAGEQASISKAPTTDLTAYNLYQQAQALWSDSSDPIHAREKLPQAASLLTIAVQRDPRFLLAWCLLAKTHGALYQQGYDRGQARLELANSAVQSALLLQPDAGEAHLALATYYYYGLGDFARAQNELKIAERVLSNNPEVFEYAGFINRRQGRWLDATHNLERALEIDPLNVFLLQQLALTYPAQRLYVDEQRTWDRLLTIVPGDPLTRATRALVAFHRRADLGPYRETLTAILAENPSVAPDVDFPSIAICGRDPVAAERSLRHYPSQGETSNGVTIPHSYWEGVVARSAGDAGRAQAAFSAARNEIGAVLKKQPDFAPALSLLGVIDAGLGRKEEAVREGRRACQLLPTTKDAIAGPALATNLAQIYAWIGAKDLAIQEIAAIELAPNRLSYGLLKLHPYWDSLRGDSRFEKIVASLAPNL